MPNMDKTGPNGQGPMTGRGLGNCDGKSGEQPLRPYCRGCGRGRGFGFRQTAAKTDEDKA